MIDKRSITSLDSFKTFMLSDDIPNYIIPEAKPNLLFPWHK
jgi:hypothetical protein